MNRRGVIALFGGAFDPIHQGHINLATRALQDLPIHGVRIIPNGAPPHRAPPATSWRQRVMRCQAATQNIRGIRVGLEESPAKTRWTIDTVRRYKRRRYRLILLLGADAFSQFGKWRQWRQIIDQTNIAVAKRGDWQPPPMAIRRQLKTVNHPRHLAHGARRLWWWQFRPGDISSTQIRQSDNWQ